MPPQKTGYIPGEQFWYKDVLWNTRRNTNTGMDVEGELYNPVFYERIPLDYLKTADGKEITADYLAQRLEKNIRWKNVFGEDVLDARLNGMKLQVTRVAEEDAPEVASDIGGAMNYNVTPKGYAANRGSSGKPFNDMNPVTAAEKTRFALFRIEWVVDPSYDGERAGSIVPDWRAEISPVDLANHGTVCVEVGDTVELWFDVTAAVDGLPQVYGNMAQAWSGTKGSEPVYFPRVGEYWHTYANESTYQNDYTGRIYVNPLSGGSFTASRPGIGAAYVNNGAVLMDMDTLLHESGFTAARVKNSDRWEMFDGSLTFIPGEAGNQNYHENGWRTRPNTLYGADGHRGTYLDSDVRTANFVQWTRYTPVRPGGAAGAIANQLPSYVKLINGYSSGENYICDDSDLDRDYNELVTRPRTGGFLRTHVDDEGNVLSLPTKWGSTTPIVWSQTRVHLQKAWLATASEMIPAADSSMASGSNPDGTAAYESQRQYLSGRDANEWWYEYWRNRAVVRDHRGVLWGQYDVTMQYNQDYTARLQALNYGDRNLDGVEFTYIFPRGAEPKLDAEGKPVVSARVLGGVSGPTGYSGSPYTAETYAAIDAAKVDVEVLQTPWGDYAGYDAPASSQNPADYRNGLSLKSGSSPDRSGDPVATSYEAVPSATTDRRGESYVASSQPWVLKITVRQPLGKWFGRTADTNAANTADRDGYNGNSGYKIFVDVASHIFSTNNSGYWYDRVLTRPIDTRSVTESKDTATGGLPSKASAYYQLFDLDHFEGRAAWEADGNKGDGNGDLNNCQPFGMDYVWSARSWAYADSRDNMGSEFDRAYGSPNMPAVNGRTVQNNTVTIDEVAAGKRMADTDAVQWHLAYKTSGAEEQPAYYVQTGTRARLRKPFVRTWTTVGGNGVTGSTSDYYLESEADKRQLNVHVENRYWWNRLAHNQQANNPEGNYYTYGGRWERLYHTYSMDGGQMGDLPLPVVTVVLPEGLAPERANGLPYPSLPDVPQVFETTDWRLNVAYDANRNNQGVLANGADRSDGWRDFKATVTYEKVADEANPANEQYRFVARFEARGDVDLSAESAASYNGADPAAIACEGAVNGNRNREQRLRPYYTDTFKFNVITVGAPRQDADEANRDEVIRSYENVRTYVSSKMDGYQFVADSDISGNPYQVGNVAQYRLRDSVWEDTRLDARQVTYRTHDRYGNWLNFTNADYSDANNNGYRTATPGVIPRHLINDGNYTRSGEPAQNWLPGFVKRYSEGQNGLDSVTPAGNAGIIVEDYRFRENYALSATSTRGLNANEVVRHVESFARNRRDADGNKVAGSADSREETGLMNGLKIRVAYPTVKTEYWVAAGTGAEGRSAPATGTGAYWDQSFVRGTSGARNNRYYWLQSDNSINFGGGAYDNGRSFEYGDTLWYTARFSNVNNGAQSSGAIKHAKLVFALELPREVTFYGGKTLMNSRAEVTDPAYEMFLGDQDGAESQFLVEWTHGRRAANGGGTVTETFTPKQLIDAGWTVRIIQQPDYTSDDYDVSAGGANYAKPDIDDPTDEAPDTPPVKALSHEGETVVFELAPPDDATDQEFVRYDNLLAAYYDGVHPDGYLGVSDAVTLKVRTRIDNLGDGTDALDGMGATYRDRLRELRCWDGGNSTVYTTVHDTDMSWLDNTTGFSGAGWTHTFKGDVMGPDGTTVLHPAGTQAVKPTRPRGSGGTAASDAAEGVLTFEDQFMSRFVRWSRYNGYTRTISDKPASVDAVTGDEIPAVDYDRDGDLTDSYSYDRSGYFRILKPSASVRGDTFIQRNLITDQDFDINLADDSHQGGDNRFVITQAINTGAAVNSFIVDWQVPYYGTADALSYDAPLADKRQPVVRTLPYVSAVRTGIWEVPGAKWRTQQVAVDKFGNIIPGQLPSTTQASAASAQAVPSASANAAADQAPLPATATVALAEAAAALEAGSGVVPAAQPAAIEVGAAASPAAPAPEAAPLAGVAALPLHAAAPAALAADAADGDGAPAARSGNTFQVNYEMVTVSGTSSSPGELSSTVNANLPVETADGVTGCTAKPARDYMFLGWYKKVSAEGGGTEEVAVDYDTDADGNGVLTAQQARASLNKREDGTYDTTIFVARFSEITYTVTYMAEYVDQATDPSYSGPPHGSVMLSGSTTGEPAMSVYEMSNQRAIDRLGGAKAIPDEGYQFAGWYRRTIDDTGAVKDELVTDIAQANGESNLVEAGDWKAWINRDLAPDAGIIYKDTLLVAKFEERPSFKEVNVEPLNREAEIESKLRVFVLARVVTPDTDPAHKAQSVFGEQNGDAYNDRENYAFPGTDADRDYFFGEDDAADYNTADGTEGTWIILGDPAGYPVSAKENALIDTTAITDNGRDIRQIRWVVKAVSDGLSGWDAIMDETAARETPVPRRFRLDVDAIPTKTNVAGATIPGTAGKQEADDFDPERLNVGWTWQTDAQGNPLKDITGTKNLIQTKSQMPSSLYDNAAGVLCHTYVLEDFIISMLSLPLMASATPLTRALAARDGEGEATVSKEAHLNHYVSGWVRYDDTKYAGAERDRVGFYRAAEYPTLKIDMEQAYFNGNATESYSWVTGRPAIDPEASRMMRYKITLTNLSTEQLKSLGIVNGRADFCSNPDLSLVLPFVEGFGAASMLNDARFKYVPYERSLDTDCPLNLGYTSKAKSHDVPIMTEKLDEEGNIVMGSDGKPVMVELREDMNDPESPIVYETIYDELASNIDTVAPMWTYHIENQDASFATTSIVPRPNVSLAEPWVGGSLTVADKLGSVGSGYNRKFMDWRFTSSLGGNTRGTLQMGQAVVIELMMPIRQDANTAISSDLMSATGYANKPGNYDPYIPAQQSNNKTSFVLDTRDSNLDGNTNQMMLSLQLEAAGFISNSTQSQSKYSSSQLGTLYTQTINGPVGVPEGTNYSYRSQAENLGASEAIAKNYVRTVLLDVLPYEDDPKLLAGTYVPSDVEGQPGHMERQARGSTWHGWIEDLDSIKAWVIAPATDPNPEGRELRPDEADIWVGPYRTDSVPDGAGGTRTKLTVLAEDSLPELWAMMNATEKATWLNDHRLNPTALRAEGFVPLDELKRYVEAHPDEALHLKHSLRSIWVEAKKDDVILPIRGQIRLTYDMHAPLNLPKYLGSTKGDAIFDMNLDPDNKTLNPDLAERLAAVTQWNSFIQRINTNGASPTGDASARVVENAMAGAFIDAPDERGYLGDYVWIDTNWDQLRNETDGAVVKDNQGRDTTMRKGPNGRFMVATDTRYNPATGEHESLYYDEAGEPQLASDLYQDVDYDGEKEDPGINGVVVELLNEHGLPVNRDGQVSQWIEGAAGDGSGRWVQCDQVTGEPLRNAGGGYINADAGAPLSFTTESDYYGNAGYWILSNILPGSYRLRYTFPKEYAGYTISTLYTGPDKDGDGVPDNKLDIEHREDDPTTPDVDETALVATTSQLIEVKPVEYGPEFADAENHRDIFSNPDALHAAYDAEATSYIVGISAPVTVEGQVFQDDKFWGTTPSGAVWGVQYDGEDGTNQDLMDGFIDRQLDQTDPALPLVTNLEEVRLGRMRVELYEYFPETETVAAEPATDAEGRPAIFITGSGANCDWCAQLAAGNPTGEAKEHYHHSCSEDGRLTGDALAERLQRETIGDFKFMMKPGHYFIIRCEDHLGTRLLKPTPYLHTKDPLAMPTDDVDAVWDNDLYLKKYTVPNDRYNPSDPDSSPTKKITKGETYPFFAKVPTDDDGVAIYEDGEKWKGYKVYRKFGLGFGLGTVGYLGNYVWNDLNYDGVQGLLEPGVPGVTVTLEQYWWNPDARGAGQGAWQLVETERVKDDATGLWEWRDKQHKTRVTNQAGQYVFAGLPTYVADPLDTDPDKMDEEKKKYLAGYRLRIDRSSLLTLNTNWGFTYRDSATDAFGPDDENDSDVRTTVMNGPVSGNPTDPTTGGMVEVPVYYLNAAGDRLPIDIELGRGSDSMIVLAGAELEDSLESNVVEVNVPGLAKPLRYDLTNPQRFENWDAGLVEIPQASITGVLWEDADYDGLRTIAADPGTGSAPGTGEGGTDPDEPAGPQVSGDRPMAGERVVLTQWYYDPTADGGAGAWLRSTTFGSDRRTSHVVGTLPVQVPNPAYDPAGTGAALQPTITEEREVRVPDVTGGISGGLVHWGDGLGAFDANALRAMAAVAGDVTQWPDLAPGEVGVLTDADGNYCFDHLPAAYTDAEGAQYLAAYQVRLYATHVDDKGTPDTSDDNHWLITRSHIGDDRTIDSDVLDRSTLAVIDRVAAAGGDRGDGSRVGDGRIILAGITDQPARTDQGSHVPVPGRFTQDGQTTVYDWLTLRRDGEDVTVEIAGDDEGADEVERVVFRGGDIGQLPAPEGEIEGIIWNDANSNGLQDAGEPGVPSTHALSVRLDRYVPDASAADGWKIDGDWTPRYEYPGAGGHWCFTDLPSQRREPDGTDTVFAYRAQVEAAPDVRNTLFIAKYQQGSDYTIDSDLRYDDSYLMDVDGDEYDVLLEHSDPRSFAGNVVTYAPSNNPNQGSAPATTVASAASADAVRAAAASLRATGPFTYDYDLALLSNRASNDGGVEIPPSADIAGKLWNDADYDGFIDEGEEVFADKTVVLKRWTYDAAANSWALADTITTRTDGNGDYRFATMPVATRVDPASPVWSLNGYTIEVNGTEEELDPSGMGGRPLTLWQQMADPDHPGGEQERNSKVARPASIPSAVYGSLYTDGNYPIAFNTAADGAAPVFQDRIVLSARAGASTATLPEYLVGGFDLTAPVSQEHMNAGFGQFRTTVLRGAVWDDSDYNGERDVHIDRLDGSLPLTPSAPQPVSEAGLPGVEMRLVRYCYRDGQWVFDDSFAATYLADVDPAAGVYDKAGDTGAVYVRTDMEGVYEFPDLPSFVPKGHGTDKDEFYLASYRVEVVRDAVTGQYVVTRFHTASATTRTDSDMTTDADNAAGNYRVRETYDVLDATGAVVSQRSDGRIMLSAPVASARNSQYALSCDGLTYDLFDAYEVQRGGDAGFKTPAAMVVSGTVWVDGDADGIWDDGEGGLPGVPVELRRYWYDVDRDQWRFDGTLGTAGVARTESGADGYWEFAHLPATGVLTSADGIPEGEGSRAVVYGYRANVVAVPDGYYPSDLGATGDIERDSDLDDATTRLIPDAPVHGLIVLASLAEPDEDEATIIPWTGASTERWSLANTHDSRHNDAGLAPETAAVIAGRIWDDDDLNGVQDAGEVPIAQGTAHLERRKVPRSELSVDPAEFDRQGWTITDGAPGSDLRGDNGEPLVPATWQAPASAPGPSPSTPGDTEWSEVATCAIDEEGRYAFDSLAMIDEDGLPWRYRVRYERPEGTFYAPLDLGGNDDVDNDWAPDDPEVSIDAGGSPALDVVVPRVGGTVNAYGQLWKLHQPINWIDREDDEGNPTGSSVDFGFTWPPTVTIAGTVWEDADADGLRAFRDSEAATADERAWMEPGVADVYVELRRYWYLPEEFVGDDPFVTRPSAAGGEATLPMAAPALAAQAGDIAPASGGGRWVYDASFNATGLGGGVPGRYSDERGRWAFTGLPTTGEVTIDGVAHRVVYGYRANVPVLPEGFEVTVLNAGDDGTIDSDLDEMNTRLVPDEPVGGLIVPSKRSDGTESALSLVQNAPGQVPRSLAQASDSLVNDTGLVPSQTVTISGVAWDDPNKDGIREEEDERLPNVVVRLERRAVASAEATARDSFGTYMADGAPGSDLDAAGEPVTRASRGPVRVPAKSGEEAPAQGNSAPATFATTEAGASVETPQAGSGTEAAEGNGAGSDGAPDAGSDGNLPTAGEPTYVTYGREVGSGAQATGPWETVGEARTDDDGAYRFEGNPLADADGNAYEYRIVAARPADASFVPSHAGASDNFDSDIDPVEGDEDAGATPALAVVELREGTVNAYGQTWKMSDPQHWTFETERSVDIGWWWEGDDSWVTKIFYLKLPQTGDTLAVSALVLLALTALTLMLASRRRKRRAQAK